MRILVITDILPYPPVSGNQLRIYHLCRQLAAKHEVWMLAPEKPSDAASGARAAMEQFCHTVMTAPAEKRSKLAHLPGLVKYLLAGRPPELKFEYSHRLAAALQELVRSVEFDIVHIEPSYIALYRDALPPELRARCVLAYHNIDFDLYKRIAAVETRPVVKFRAAMHSRFMRRWEPWYAGRFAGCITCSERDKSLLQNANPRVRVDVVPNGVDTAAYQPLPPQAGRPSLLFVGSMSYTACVDGAVFFHQSILPRIREQLPDVETWFVGRDPAAEVERLRSDSVHVTGWVEDILPYYERATLAVVPLRAGGGTRLKILEAMALGRAVVSTSIGCEGLDVTDGKNIMIADDPAEFAGKTAALLTDASLRAELAENARQLVVRRYDWAALAEKQAQIYRDVLDTASMAAGSQTTAAVKEAGAS